VTSEPAPDAPNAFEAAILRALARELPALTLEVEAIRVLDRKYTGVGSYTDFVCDVSGDRELFRLKAPIAMPGVPGGMGAVLYCHSAKPACLETFSIRDAYWTGAFEGFSVG